MKNRVKQSMEIMKLSPQTDDQMETFINQIRVSRTIINDATIGLYQWANINGVHTCNY